MKFKTGKYILKINKTKTWSLEKKKKKSLILKPLAKLTKKKKKKNTQVTNTRNERGVIPTILWT